MLNTGVTSTEVIRSDKMDTSLPDLLVVEEPLQIRLNYGPMDDRREVDLSITMRTPGHDLELVAGFLVGEGIIHERSDLLHLDYCQTNVKEEEQGNVVRAELRPECSFDEELSKRNFYSSASCGVCGKSSIDQLCKVIPPNQSPVVKFDKGVIEQLPELIKTNQVNFSHTGGIHAAALIDESGNVIMCREDIGRHNAVDKIIGASFLKGQFPLGSQALFLSGRVGFELMQKALMAGIQVIAAVGAPSSLSVKMAKESRVTLIGFLRAGNFNVYSGVERISTP